MPLQFYLLYSFAHPLNGFLTNPLLGTPLLLPRLDPLWMTTRMTTSSATHRRKWVSVILKHFCDKTVQKSNSFYAWLQFLWPFAHLSRQNLTFLVFSDSIWRPRSRNPGTNNVLGLLRIQSICAFRIRILCRLFDLPASKCCFVGQCSSRST